MKTVRTTFLSDQKNRSVYLDFEETCNRIEQETGKPVTGRRREIQSKWAMVINAAYDDGFRDGIDEMLERIAKEIEDGKAN